MVTPWKTRALSSWLKNLTQDARCKVENIFRFYDNIVQLLKSCKVQLIYYLVIVKLKCCTVISYFLLQIPRENTYLG